MKVLVLATDAFGGYGGIAQYNRDFIEALSSTDACEKVEILVRIGDASDLKIPKNTVQFKPISSKIFYAAFAIIRAILFRPDLVVCAHLYHGPLAFFIAALTRARLSSQLHGTEVWHKLSHVHSAVLERSDIVFCVSRDTRLRVIEQTRDLHERTVVLTNTFGEAFTPGDRLAARKRFGLTDERVVLTVARLDGREGYKGHDRVITALSALVKDSLGSVVYLIAGDGEDRDRLEKLAHSHGIGHLVRFLGKVSFADLPDLYRAADLFALPSTGEGFGIAFIEAMACGTPAIGLRIGGAPDALGDGELGYCVAPEDFESAFFEALQCSNQRDSTLPERIKGRFGRELFQKRIRGFVEKLQSLNW